ncbi:MAG: ABC transporter ATP-binding protein [Actinomycetaceae bacterium]|nr:ABC transporter ATP-binding protein [Actinomycetaceae bacterium]
MSLLTLQNLDVKRRGKPILKNINLRIDAGEMVVLMGSSGAGKSTLLRAICGLQRLHSGRILLAGKDITDQPVHLRSAAMVMDEAGLFPHYTVRENIRFAVRESSEITANEQVEVALTGLDLSHLAERYPRELSTGQQQKVALARALVRRPKIMLFDEPFAHVDRASASDLGTALQRMHRRLGCAALFVTHDIEEAYALADRVVHLSNGEVVQDDFPEEVHDRPASLEIARACGAQTFLTYQGRVEVNALGEVFLVGELLGQNMRVNAAEDFAAWQGDTKDSVVVAYPNAVSLSVLPPSSHDARVQGPIGQVNAQTYRGQWYVTEVESELGTVVAYTPTDPPTCVVGDRVRINLDQRKLWALPLPS